MPLDVAAYIAGLVDGEGTITLSRLHPNESRRLVVSIANTELVLLEYVHRQVGAGKITRKRASSERHTPSFCYSVAGRQALTLLRQIAPWLLSYKRGRAEIALDSYLAVTPRNGKYTAESQARRRSFERDFLAILPSNPLPRSLVRCANLAADEQDNVTRAARARGV